MDKRLDNLMTFERIFNSKSFISAADERFNIKFKNSSIEEITNKLEQLRHNVENDIHIGKHVGFIIELPLVVELQESLQTILSDYRTLTNSKHIPTSFKLYEIIEKLKTRLNDDLQKVLDAINEIPKLKEVKTPKENKPLSLQELKEEATKIRNNSKFK